MKKKFLALLLCILSLFSFVGCNGASYRLKLNYYGYDEYTQILNKADYSTDLFYRNNAEIACPDPCVIHIDDVNSDEYGWFYMYGTTASNSFLAWKSKDLINWNGVGAVLKASDMPEDFQKVINCYHWAPEVIFDSTDRKYHMFFSAGCTENGLTVKKHVEYHAISDSPAGPFFLDNDSENDGRVISCVCGEKDEEGRDKICYHIQQKYSLFNLDKYREALEAKGFVGDPAFNNYISSTIDAHAYVDPLTGKKYLYIRSDRGPGLVKATIVVMEMETWTRPKYDTVTTVIEASKTTVGGSEVNFYEGASQNCNEGPFVWYHDSTDDGVDNGKYYMTISVFGFENPNYAVYQAVADSPVGPFRKLTIEEGGLLMQGGKFDNVTATGHHSFVQKKDELFIVYHAYTDVSCEGSRYVFVDKINWVGITDRNGEEYEVMYANGPTVAPQPLHNFVSEYKNVALGASVSAKGLTKESDPSCLTDGLIAVNEFCDPFIEKYVGFVTARKKATITITFDDWVEARAIMIYQSHYDWSFFKEIELIEFDCIDDDGNEYVAFIEDLKYNLKDNRSENGLLYRPGSAALAEFNSIKTKKVRITVPLATPSEEELLDEIEFTEFTLSEIVVLGKEC